MQDHACNISCIFSQVEMIAVADDCALTSSDKSAGRRGLAGTVFVHKIAGAMTENGNSMNEILEQLHKVTKNLGK